MHVHLPKPLRNWREFLKEYAIIVLGVLTALGLEQAVQSVHDRRLAREAQAAIRQEMQGDLDRVAYRIGQQSCIEKRLAEIQALLARWHGEDAFPDGVDIGFPGDVGLVDQRWQANLASGRFNEESPQDQEDQAGLYSLIHVIDSVELREINDWKELGALGLGSRTLPLESKATVAAALANARFEARSFQNLSQALLLSLGGKATKDTRLTPRGDFVPAAPGTACQPMGKPA